jgi:hypothetical protein
MNNMNVVMAKCHGIVKRMSERIRLSGKDDAVEWICFEKNSPLV